MKSTFLAAIFGLAMLFIMPSCNKDHDSIFNTTVSSADDISTQQFLLEVNEMEIDEQVDNALTELVTRGFPTRTWAQPKGTFPNTLTIDYGPDGVTGPYGHVRKGQLVITFSALMSTAGAVRTVSHENFSIDDVRIEGTVSLTNKGLNPSGQPEFARVVLNRKLIFPSGKTSSWEATQTLTQLEGSKTLIRIDDVWSITGSASGINREGKSIALNTMESLIFPVACHYFVKGIISLSANNEVFSIDYGYGICNNDAILTLPDGSQQAIKIRRWW